MKYPQSVSMPEAVRYWLEEQLEARGIDSAIYSRYIFSLLQQKTFDDLPTREAKRGRKRGHRDYVLDLDQQRRSAAVECLMSASDQKTGIETLVDELCSKLKVIQSEASRPQELAAKKESIIPLPSNLSSHDLESKYYAAFPPLSSKDKTNAEVFTSQIPSNGNTFSVWNGKKILGCSFGKNQFLFNAGVKDKSASLKSKWEEEDKENQFGKIEVAGNEKMRSRSMVKQQITHKVRRNMAKSLDRKDDLLKLRVTFDSGKARRLDESNFSKLLAKFDGVKDIWASEKSCDDLSGCDEDLPMDFQQLLNSPDTTASSENLPFELFKNNNNKENNMTCGTSFIQCGTNITSSIWSEKADGINKLKEGCDIFGRCTKTDDIIPSISVGSVWSNATSGYNTSEDNIACDPWGFRENVYLDLSSKDMDFQLSDENLLQDKKTISWSSDVDDADLKMRDEELLCKQNINLSLLTLNHNKEGSCFIEVVPTKSMWTLQKYGSMKPKLMNCWKQTDPLTGVCWDEEEEDLLTSMRTHFQPITAKEVVEVIKEKATAAVPKYADGTTFDISCSWEKPSFLRSDSGALYLDSDPDQKYMEFNFDPLDTFEDFIPKFKVCQNEKFCQTEDIPMNNCDNKEFYFPGDEKYTEDSIEKDSAATCITVDGWVAAWPAGIWSNTPQPWCDVWSAEVSVVHEDGDHYLKLRDEILEEGEELLSDLSSMQHLFLSSDEALPVAPPPRIEPGFICKTNSIPLSSSEMARKTSERHNMSVTAPHKDSKRQTLSSISAWTGSVII